MQKPLRVLSKIEDRIESVVLDNTIERAVLLSYVLAGLFGTYGFTSIHFIQRFSPGVTLWANTWPRVLLSGLPFFILGKFIRKVSIDNHRKVLLWIMCFASILHLTAWIHIWPIALHGKSEILTYVNGPNVYLFALIYAGVAPSKRLLIPFSGILFAIFVLPLILVAYFSGDPVVFKLVLSDAISALAGAMILGRAVEELHRRVVKLELEKGQRATQFLGPVISKAIFEDELGRLETVRCRGFIVTLDVRESTEFQQIFGQRWLDFRRDYFSLMSQTVNKWDGYIQKTIGDCHVLNFGVIDYGVSLLDIPGLEWDLKKVEDMRLQRASNAAFGFLDDLIAAFQDLVKHYDFGRPLSLGAGVDKGWVQRGVQGHESFGLEFDVNGDPVNCSNRLQEYSKHLPGAGKSDHSLLVVSPFASDYLRDLASFVRISTIENSIRNYHGIKWVLVKRYVPGMSRKAVA